MKVLLGAIIAALALTFALAPPAESHTLWKSKAERITWRVAKGFCYEELTSCDSYDIACARRDPHRVNCDLGFYWTEYDYITETDEEYQCNIGVQWYYRGHKKPRNRLVRFRVLYGDCAL